MSRLIVFCLCAFFVLSPLNHAIEKFQRATYTEEVEGRPLDVILSQLTDQFYSMKTEKSEAGEDLSKKAASEESFGQDLKRVMDHITSEELFWDISDLYKESDPMVREALNPLVSKIIRHLNSVLQKDPQAVRGVRNPRTDLFPDYSPLSQLDFTERQDRVRYEYRLGRELDRKIVKTYEAIHRRTMMENIEHHIDIDVDFLKPIKKVIETLKLKEKFSWLWNQKLRWGYHSHFKHHKKIFTRQQAFYDKISVKFELWRREKGIIWDGDWERCGTSNRMVEEVAAMVAKEAKQLD
jgi:hypothetical protein